MAARMRYMPAHDGIFLLSKAISTNRVTYLLRTTSGYRCPTVSRCDSQLRDITAALLNINITYSRWSQANLPVAQGGIGIRCAALLAPSAFLASAAGASDLITEILPRNSGFALEDYGKEALQAWQELIEEAELPEGFYQAYLFLT